MTRIPFLIPLALMILGFLGCAPESRITWQELDTPAGILRIQYDPPPAFGSHTLHFQAKQADGKGEFVDIASLELNNDGANLGAHNLEVLDRTPTGIRFMLHGQQQADMTLEFRRDAAGSPELLREN